MADNSYTVEIKPASKNGYFTPAEARAYYGRYSRDNYIVHWWGNGAGASGHNSIVNYILGTAAAGNMSVNYVLSDNAITMLVYLMNVSWGAQGGNPTGINVEHQPTLGDEGYKKSGWLKEQCEQVVGKRLGIKRHSDYFATACPGTISLDRIEQECDNWRRGVYDQPPAPIPTPPPVTPPPPAGNPIVQQITPVKKYTLSNAKLVNIKDMSVVKVFALDTEIEIGGKSTYNGKTFYLSAYATSKGTLQGFLEGDLKDSITAPPVPTTPPPVVVPPTAPEWVANLTDIDDTEYWLTKDQDLIDITTGKPTGTKTFKKDESFVASAVTKVGNIEYRITDYSYKKGIYNGVPISSLTLTKPGVPDIPPVPNFEQRLSRLEKIVQLLWDYISRYKLFQKFIKDKGVN